MTTDFNEAINRRQDQCWMRQLRLGQGCSLQAWGWCSQSHNSQVW